MKLTYDQTRDRRQIQRLVKLFLTSRKGELISCMAARQKFAELYGIDIDHHEYANALDEMSRTGEATIQGWDKHGDTQYLIE
jgi:hypothetical protein